ncbi:hypothetical protein, partial [Devosia sp.]|uniref:hypothetical protein n=1 Tax=Devosia sp. TaxID=1871048 RepID=UPI0026267526
MLLLVSLVSVLNRPLLLPKLSPLLVVFIGYCAIVIGLQTVGGSMDRYAVSQSNHIVQFALYYF